MRSPYNSCFGSDPPRIHRTSVLLIASALAACTSGSGTRLPPGSETDAGSSDLAALIEKVDGGSADLMSASTGEVDGAAPSTNEPGGPIFLSLGRSRASVTEGEAVTFTAVLTDPDGIDDLIGGTLKSSDLTVSYGAFISSGQEGSYSLTVPFSALAAAGSNFFALDQRLLVAEFFDVSGKRATAAIEVTLGCGFGRGVCNGVCVEHTLVHAVSTHPAAGKRIMSMWGDGTTVYAGGDVILRRESTGAWTQEMVPTNIPLDGLVQMREFYGSSSGDLSFVFRQSGYSYMQLVTRRSGAWAISPWNDQHLFVHAAQIYRYDQTIERQQTNGSWVDEAQTSHPILALAARDAELFAGRIDGTLLHGSGASWSVESSGLSRIDLLGVGSDRLFALGFSGAGERLPTGLWRLEDPALIAGTSEAKAMWISDDDVFVSRTEGVFHAFTGKAWTKQLAVACTHLARVGQRLICLAAPESSASPATVWEADVALPCE